MRVVIVGGGFAGYHAARCLLSYPRRDVEVVLVNPTDHFCYLPLLPEVAAGVLHPLRVAVSIPETLPGLELVLGQADEVDLERGAVGIRGIDGSRLSLRYDRLLLATGAVNKLLSIPGVAEHGLPLRDVADARRLRDHLTRQIEHAATTDDPQDSAARTTFVVAGAGYTGTEITAQGSLLTASLARDQAGLDPASVRWILVELAPRLLPEFDTALGEAAEGVLYRRGVEIRTGTSISSVDPDGVVLSTGQFVPSRTVVWCVGVRPDPFVAGLGLPTREGRLVVDTELAVPGHPEVYAAGDAAAVPDLTRPGELTAMTAQHAGRQGRCAAANIGADHGYGRRRRYQHRGLGFVVDLGGVDAVANPLQIPLAGIAAKVVARAVHLAALPANRARTVLDWALDALLPRQTRFVEAGGVPARTSMVGSRIDDQ